MTTYTFYQQVMREKLVKIYRYFLPIFTYPHYQLL